MRFSRQYLKLNWIKNKAQVKTLALPLDLFFFKKKTVAPIVLHCRLLTVLPNYLSLMVTYLETQLCPRQTLRWHYMTFHPTPNILTFLNTLLSCACQRQLHLQHFRSETRSMFDPGLTQCRIVELKLTLIFTRALQIGNNELRDTFPQTFIGPKRTHKKCELLLLPASSLFIEGYRNKEHL